MTYSLAWITGEERFLTMSISTNQRFCHNNFEIQQSYENNNQKRNHCGN